MTPASWLFQVAFCAISVSATGKNSFLALNINVDSEYLTSFNHIKKLVNIVKGSCNE